jgi:hypothetical protein
MFDGILLDPFQNRVVFLKSVDGVFERVAVDLQKAKEMLIETNGFVIVTVEQTLAVKLRFID